MKGDRSTHLEEDQLLTLRKFTAAAVAASMAYIYSVLYTLYSICVRIILLSIAIAVAIDVI